MATHSSQLEPVQQALDFDERERLHELEAVVERGVRTFIEVGEALREIRDGRLYRETHGTFEVYCRERWGFARSTAYQYLDAADVVSAIADTGLPAPENEGQARELAPLRDEPENMAEAWREANSDGEPTAAKVREAVSRHRPMNVHYSSARDDWETPQALFDILDREFAFGLDVCASEETAKCPQYYTPTDDALSRDWHGRCFMNPPYGDVISTWVEKAYTSAQAGATVVCLVPARVDTRWWWDYCRHGEVRFLPGRLRFSGGDAAPFPSAVVVFGPGIGPKTRYWAWRTN